VKRDLERLDAVRQAFGDDIEIMVDANTGYALDDVWRVMPALEDNHVILIGWREIKKLL
jgi:L-alanine-DL-glutamate epimerase-like enolase superfamily enzyme